MLSFFRRKKPQDAPATEAPKTQHYSAEELAAAFPSAAPAEDKEPAPVAAPTAPAPVEPPPAAVAPVTIEPSPVATAPVVPAVPAPTAPSPITQIDVAPVATPAIEPVPSPLPEPTPAPVTDDLPAAASVDAVPATAGKPGWRERLRNSVIARSFGGLFSRNPKLDDDLLDELETALITADVGVGATTDLVEGLRKRMKAREFVDANALLAALRAELIAILQPVAKPLVIDRTAKPFVVLTVGVNGVGKTTTIGKLAKRFKDEGHSLMLAAGDTFRAAAVAQLQAWGERNGVAVVAQGQNADAASVAFDALQAGKARGTSVLIADTAGRLHTQSGLMNELGKIRRVLGKIDPTAPHEVLMVIDGTTGQNALSQLRQFNAAVNVTGLVVTKLDGTAKGGVVFALAREFGIPIRFAGIGERPEDLRVFDPEAFVDALLPEALGA
ncbi:signal recognition particle-docking protein FtsY [Stenotrophomonas maltophilia]|nr:signal recognition particle-docking protein FtsY [Stenotrophomonas maltophilia]